MAIIDFFDRGWSINANAVAYRTDSEAWTYDEAGRMSCRIANALIADGIARETKVAVLSPNDPLAWICVLGTWRAGGTWVPLNPSSSVADNITLLERFDVEIVFYHPSLSAQVGEIRDRVPSIRFIALDQDVTGGVIGGVSGGVSGVITGVITVDANVRSWIVDQPETRPDVAYDMDDVVAIAPTGGTTGLPKGVMNTNRSFSVMVAHQLLAFAYPDDEPIVNLAAAPMTHSAGLLTLHVTARGGSVVIVDRAQPALILSAIERYGVTEIFLPPTVVYRLLEELDDRKVDTSSLRHIIYGAAPMSVDKLRAGLERLGPVFVEVYGQMESPAAISFLRPPEHFIDGKVAPDSRLASCGRPYPLVTLAIKDPQTGRDLPVGETGEICVRGDLLMKGYYKDPERTAEAIRDGWLHTGDLGHLDDHGYLRLTDRAKDMIITGGFNVYPGEVEQVIWGHPSVEDCAVIGAPDTDWGERVTAVVELKPGAAVSEEEVQRLCRDALGPVRTPKAVVFVDRLPRSVNGKVLKKDVRASFWADHTRTI
ncbi:long-chain fatty acid--CoA ligase [Nocardioides sp. Soil797]|nr:long-chain fatty acid--CoA ligase [Nocardioides sp. Soil797]